MSCHACQPTDQITGRDGVLSRIKQHLKLHKQATLGDLALHFHIPVPAMRGMVETWIRKGRVRELDARATCNVSCALACDSSAMTIYEWIERGADRAQTSTFIPQDGKPVGDGSCHTLRS